MIIKIVAIYDNAVECFSQPSFVPALGVAVRSFGDEVKREGTPDRPNNLNLHPDDYELFEIGTYDDQTAELVAIAPRKLASATDYK